MPPEGLTTADGTPVSVPGGDFSDFQRAQARAADSTAEAPAPPKKDYGLTVDGRPKKAAGRPRKTEDKPRITDAPAAVVSAPVKDRTAGLTDLVDSVWGVACLVSQPDAGAIHVAKPALVKNWNTAAAQNPKVGRVVDKVTGASALSLAVGATVVLGIQIAVNHKALKAEAFAHMGVKSPEELAEANKEAMLEYVSRMEAAQAAAETERDQLLAAA